MGAASAIAHWKTDAGLLARAYAWEGYHRGDPGRVIAGLDARPDHRRRRRDDADRLADRDRPRGSGGDRVLALRRARRQRRARRRQGAARRRAKALILAGKLDEALDQIQIVQLRRSQSRLEAEINRLLRLAAIRPAARVGARDRAPARARREEARADGGARPRRLRPGHRHAGRPARARRRARRSRSIRVWIAELIGALPAAQATAGAILARLARPERRLARSPPTRSRRSGGPRSCRPRSDRDAHAAGAVLALGVALAQYFAEASVAPTPIAGAYRHIATEALHLVRRSRYQIEPAAIRALLALVERLGDAPEWLLDTWLLRIERALDLEAEHGAYLEAMHRRACRSVQRLLRGDERDRLGAAARARPRGRSVAVRAGRDAVRALRARGRGRRRRARVVGRRGARRRTAQAQPRRPLARGARESDRRRARRGCRVARGLLATGKPKDGFAAACRGMTAATAQGARRRRSPSSPPAWQPPRTRDADRRRRGVRRRPRRRLRGQARRRGPAPALGRRDASPATRKRAQSLAVALGRARPRPRGDPRARRRTSATMRRASSAACSSRPAATPRPSPILRYASRRFRTADDWALLAIDRARAPTTTRSRVEAGASARRARRRRTRAARWRSRPALYRLGEFVECEKIAQQLITGAADARASGSSASTRWRARSPARAATSTRIRTRRKPRELGPNGELAAELDRDDGPHRRAADAAGPAVSAELSMERQACADLEAGNVRAAGRRDHDARRGASRAPRSPRASSAREDESGIPVAPRALDAAVAILDAHARARRIPRPCSRASARCASATTRSSRSIRRRRSACGSRPRSSSALHRARAPPAAAEHRRRRPWFLVGEGSRRPRRSTRGRRRSPPRGNATAPRPGAPACPRTARSRRGRCSSAPPHRATASRRAWGCRT